MYFNIVEFLLNLRALNRNLYSKLEIKPLLIQAGHNNMFLVLGDPRRMKSSVLAQTLSPHGVLPISFSVTQYLRSNSISIL